MNLCKLCGEVLGRGHAGYEYHYSCITECEHVLQTLGQCLREAGLLAHAFEWGRTTGHIEELLSVIPGRVITHN